MRIPTPKQRLLAVPILIVAMALVLVRADIILADELSYAFLAAIAYVGIEVLFTGARRKRK